MPEPLEDLNRDHQCHFYQAPTGQRCGSPALKGEYYCYFHHLKHAKRNQGRVLIDPEVTRMELPVIEDRASIFVALTAVIHRLAENTIDTRRAGQMIYALQVAMRALEPPRIPRVKLHPDTEAPSAAASSAAANYPATSTAAGSEQPPTPPKTITITKEGLLYFLRSRHCAHCNAELFPAEELTERRHPGAPPEVIPEAHQALDSYECLILGASPALNSETPPAGLPPTVQAQSAGAPPDAAHPNPTVQTQPPNAPIPSRPPGPVFSTPEGPAHSEAKRPVQSAAEGSARRAAKRMPEKSGALNGTALAVP